jgi:hypothetical protein
MVAPLNPFAILAAAAGLAALAMAAIALVPAASKLARFTLDQLLTDLRDRAR